MEGIFLHSKIEFNTLLPMKKLVYVPVLSEILKLEKNIYEKRDMK